MRKTLTMFLVLWLLASSFFAFNNSAYGNLGAENTWSEKTPINQARAGLGVVAVDGKIYAIGDSTASGTYPPDMFYSGFVGTNEEYDPAALTWTTKLSVPTLRSSFGIAVHENKIYVIGSNVGFDSATELPILCSINEVYDPLTDIWESKKPMPTNRSQLNANVVNGKIYLIGGRIGGQYSTVDLNEVYDPETDSWTTRAPIPYPVVQ